MDVDKLFKLPKLPASQINKRKWAEPTNEQIKAHKQRSDQHASASSPPSKSKRTTVADEDGEDEAGRDGGWGRASSSRHGLDSADDDNAFEGELDGDDDDEGGRMYGGGLTDQQQQILEIMNRAGDDDDSLPKAEEQLANMRRTLLRFERAINKNQEMRVRFADEPEMFIESEADLDASLKALLLLTTNPALFYPETVKHGTPASLASLLSHENPDIVASVIEAVEELTDDDVLDSGDGVEDEEDEAERDGAPRKGEEGMRIFVDSLLENDFLDLLVQNLGRFSDDPNAPSTNGADADSAAAQANLESDTAAIFHLLGVLENLLSFRPSLAAKLVDETKLLPWLLKRVSRKGGYDQNKGYAGEILAILTQGGQAERIADRVGELEGIDTLLNVLAVYRKRDPAEADETEFMENIFDVLCACSTTAVNKQRFFEAEGVELMCILMKERRLVRLRAIKALNFAMSGPRGGPSCERFVERGGLGTLFSAFMGKGAKKGDAPTAADEEHILGVLVSLFNSLASDSAERLRLVAKFVEEGYAKADRLLELREACAARLSIAESEIDEERRELLDEGETRLSDEEEELFYLRRLESGLFSLQMVDYVLAWVAMEDDGVRAHLNEMLARKGKGFGDTIEVLKEYYENVGDDAVVVEAESESEAPLRLRDVIVELVNFLLAAGAEVATGKEGADGGAVG